VEAARGHPVLPAAVTRLVAVPVHHLPEVIHRVAAAHHRPAVLHREAAVGHHLPVVEAPAAVPEDKRYLKDIRISQILMP
jgi:hypothetical protein